ncbi:MAG: metallophosphoesterase [Clostridiales Family XIII bacterium]|jgi:Icc-related predicted phosphoesterase|nr:metallophosphoesterase [Clostridiales Family XIII bacterium]
MKTNPKNKITAILLAALICAALSLSACQTGATDGVSGEATPQRFIQIEGDVLKYVSFKTGTPTANDSAMPGDKGFEGTPLTEFVGQAGLSGTPRELWIMSSGDGFAVKLAWAGAEKAFVKFSGTNGWTIVAPEHPISANAQDIDRIIVVSECGRTGLNIVKPDGTREVVPFGKLLTSPMLLNYHLEGKADTGGSADDSQGGGAASDSAGGGKLSSEVYTRELSVALADVYDGYGGASFEITTGSGERFLTDGKGRFSVKRQTISYIETTGDIYENVSQISFRGESDKAKRSEFLFFGDMQTESSLSEYGDTGRLIGGAAAAHPKADLALQCGDLGNTGDSPEEWDALTDMLTGSLGGLPLFTTPGNHEFTPYAKEGDRKPEKYLDVFELPENGPEGYKELYYSFDYGSAHVVSLAANYLNPAEGYSDDEAENARIAGEIDSWIERDLARTDKPWKIVMTHQPPFPVEGDNTATGFKERWLPIFERNGVDLILCGHQHEIMRTFPLDAGGNTVDAAKGMVEIMGNASAKSYESGTFSEQIAAFEMGGIKGYHDIEITPTKLSTTAYNEAGKQIDYWEKSR